jgi:hypothetical protein
MFGPIHAKLSSVVAANQLQRFYPPQALQALASRLDARVNFRDLAARCGACCCGAVQPVLAVHLRCQWCHMRCIMLLYFSSSLLSLPA